MKKIFAIISAILTGAIGLAMFTPHAANAGWQLN
jgi:hypothetical protein